MILLLKKAKRDSRGQKPEEIYVIEDQQLQDIDPNKRTVVIGDYSNRKLPNM
jgi:hypothetical protein